MWCLINISYFENDSCVRILSTFETLEILETYLDKYLKTAQYLEITNCIIWLIGHIIFDSPNVALYIINTLKIISKIHEIITLHHDVSNTLMRNVCWFIFDPFIKNKKITTIPDDFAEVASDMLLIFSKQKDKDLRIDSIFALDQLLQKTANNQMREKIIEQRLIDSILSSRFDQDRDLLIPCIKLLGQMLAGDNYIIDALVEKDVIPFLKVYLSDKNCKIRKDTCWAISNITCSNLHLKMLQNHSIFEELISLVRNDINNVVKKEALWALVNTCIYGDFPLISYLNKQGIIQIFQKNIDKNGNDTEILEIIFEALCKIFEIGKVIAINGENPYVKEFLKFGGQDTLETISDKFGKNDKLYNIIFNLSTKYIND